MLRAKNAVVRQCALSTLIVSKLMTLNSILLLFNLGTGEIVIIALVVLLLFGGRKIPELMKGLGKGVRGFKEGLNDVQNEINRPLNELDELNAKKEAERREQKENRMK